MNLEQIILSNLIDNEQYSRRVIPFLNTEYFHDNEERLIFSLINDYFVKYNATVSKQALLVELVNNTTLDQKQLDKANQIVNSLETDPKTEFQWLVDKTEKFCQEKAIYNALSKSISIADNKDKKQDKNAIPKILTDALAVSFDTNVGHDFTEDSDLRYEYYHKEERKIPFDIEWFNIVTKGGVENKTLNIVMGGTGAGKTLTLASLAASYLSMGMNVLYITLEIADLKIAERIEANLLDVTIDDLHVLAKDNYNNKIKRMKSRVASGRLIIKEYPPTSINTIFIRRLLDELKVKKNFKPTVIFIDSLNLMLSSRYKASQVADLYQHGKNVAEEVRGLAVEMDIPIWSAIQLNREGFKSSNPGLGNTGESFAIPQTTDLLWILVTNEQLAELSQIMVVQGKNRYRDESLNRKFMIGIDKSKMRIYNVEKSAQADLIDNKKEKVVIDKRSKRLTQLFEGFDE